MLSAALAGLAASLALSAAGQADYETPYTITTLAGYPGNSGVDGTGSEARFNQPSGVAVDGAGNVYVADTQNQAIRKVTPAGVVTTLAGMPGSSGRADGTGGAARFEGPSGVATDGAGNIYVADTWACTVREVTPAGVVTTLAGLPLIPGSADGTGSAAQFCFPGGVAVDSAGNIYVADTDNNTIREIMPDGTNWVVTTLAGTAGSSGSADGTGSAAQFNQPFGVAVDGAGNVYVADTGNNTIREITPAGVVTTLAGTAGSGGTNDGPGSIARFNHPSGVAVDSAGNLYVADTQNCTIRKVTPTGVVTTLAGGAFGPGGTDGIANVATFVEPLGVAVDGAGTVYVADTWDDTIRKVTPTALVTPAGAVTTLAGVARMDGSADGTGNAARFDQPCGVAVDSAGNVYVADTLNSTIREVTPAGAVTTLAGLAGSPGSADGTGSAAQFEYPSGVAVDGAGNVYVADTSSHTIRIMTPVGTNWVVTTLAGLAGTDGSADGAGSEARFYNPKGVAVDSAGNVYVADTWNNTIRKATPVGTNWAVTTLAGMAGSFGSQDGTGNAARFYYPEGVAVDSAGNLYVTDTYNCTLRKVTPSGVVTTLAGLAHSAGSADGTGSVARFNAPWGVAVDSADNLYVADKSNCAIRKVTPAGVVTTFAGVAATWGSADGTGSAARFLNPSGVAVDSAGNVYVADCGNDTIRQMTPSAVVTTLQVVTTLAGQVSYRFGSADGTGSAARFNNPCGVAVDSAGNVYVADTENSTIRMVTPAGVVTTLAGDQGNWGSADGVGSAARFFYPSGVAVDSAGTLYVADYFENTIRKVTPVGTNWVVTTLAGTAGSSGSADGTGKAARFHSPGSVAVDGVGNVYVADTDNHTIRRVTPVGTNWVVTTLAGTAGVAGSADGTGKAAQFNYPVGVAVDGAGNLYVADSENDTIRQVTPVGTNWVVTTLAGMPGSGGNTDGAANAAQFVHPRGVAVDNAGNVYVADYYNDTIREVIIGMQVTTLAGLAGHGGHADGTGAAARFNYPCAVAVDGAGNFYVADYYNNAIRKGVPGTSVPPPVLYRPNVSAGQVGLGITGVPGLVVDVYSSSDLQDWQWAGGYVLDGGTNYFVSPTSAQGAQFYQGYVR